MKKPPYDTTASWYLITILLQRMTLLLTTSGNGQEEQLHPPTGAIVPTVQLGNNTTVEVETYFREATRWSSPTYMLGMGHNAQGDPSQNPGELLFPTNSHSSRAKAAKDFQPLFFFRSPALFPFRKRQFYVKLSKCTLMMVHFIVCKFHIKRKKL